MFLIRPQLLSPIIQAQLKPTDFDSKVMHTGGNSTLAHAMERIFIPLTLDQHFLVYGLNYFPHTFKVRKRQFLNWLFCITNEHERKIIRICGFTVPLHPKPRRKRKNINFSRTHKKMIE